MGASIRVGAGCLVAVPTLVSWLLLISCTRQMASPTGAGQFNPGGRLSETLRWREE